MVVYDIIFTTNISVLKTHIEGKKTKKNEFNPLLELDTTNDKCMFYFTA